MLDSAVLGSDKTYRVDNILGTNRFDILQKKMIRAQKNTHEHIRVNLLTVHYMFITIIIN